MSIGGMEFVSSGVDRTRFTAVNIAPILVAGFSCGLGLIGLGTVAIALVAKSVTQLPF